MNRASRALLGSTGLLGVTAALSGCHVDMWQQPKVKTNLGSDFFLDQQGNRPVVEGTVARGQLRLDEAYVTGKSGGKPIKTIPARAVQALGGPAAMLDRGQEKFNVYCQPCHGRIGDGNGFVAQRGLGYWKKLPASLLIDRLKKAEDGHIYDVLVNGKGVMYGYSTRIQDVNDRWAVVAYVRTLQRVHTDHPEGIKPELMEANEPKYHEGGAAEGGEH